MVKKVLVGIVTVSVLLSSNLLACKGNMSKSCNFSKRVSASHSTTQQDKKDENFSS